MTTVFLPDRAARQSAQPLVQGHDVERVPFQPVQAALEHGAGHEQRRLVVVLVGEREAVVAQNAQSSRAE